MGESRRRWLVACVPPLLAGALAGCHGGESSEPKATPPPVRVVVTRAVATTVPITNEFVATTVSPENVEVRARVQGVLETVNFKPGSLVRKGQLLFTIQKEKYVADVEAAQGNVLKAKAALLQAQDTVPVQQAEAVVAQNLAKVGQARTTVNRLQPLAAAHAVPQKDLDNAVSELEVAVANLLAARANLKNAKVNQEASIASAKGQVLSAQADLDNADLNLSYCTISSPVTGLIGLLKYDQGNVVGNADTQVLDTVSQIDPMKADFAADEGTYLAIVGRNVTYQGKLLRYQPVTMLLSNNAVFPYKGSLYTVNSKLDTKTGTITAEAMFPNPDGTLRPGQFGRLRLVVDQRVNAVIVPQSAIIETQGTPQLMVVKSDNTVALRSVQLGPSYGNYYVIDRGVSAGERVITEGTQKAQPGATVEIASSSK